MKVKVRKAGDKEPEPVYIKSAYIKLDALLKFAALVQTGGEAKLVIAEGAVSVNGAPTLERGKKIRPGDVVRFGKTELKVMAAPGETQA
jgi:ribosome-associated protein